MKTMIEWLRLLPPPLNLWALEQCNQGHVDGSFNPHAIEVATMQDAICCLQWDGSGLWQLASGWFMGDRELDKAPIKDKDIVDRMRSYCEMNAFKIFNNDST